MPEDYSTILLEMDPVLAMMCQSASLSDLNFLVDFSEITVAVPLNQSIRLKILHFCLAAEHTDGLKLGRAKAKLS